MLIMLTLSMMWFDRFPELHTFVPRMAMDAAEPVNVRMREAMLTTWKRYGLPAGAYGVGYGGLARTFGYLKMKKMS